MGEAEQRAREKLKEVIDPGANLNVVDMGLIRDLSVSHDGVVNVVFRPSSPVCPLAFVLAADIKKALEELGGVNRADLKAVDFARADELNKLMEPDPSSGKVVAVCLSEERGTVKRNVGAGHLKEGYGLVGDAHAGSDKQVSLLALEDVQKVCVAEGIEAGPGDFAENITTSGIDLVSLPVGSRLQLGEAVIKVTRIGKEKHLVHIYNYKGVSILPERGAFASVERSGYVRMGDEITAIS